MNTSRQVQRTWKPSPMMLKTITTKKKAIQQFIHPENSLEKRIVNDKDWQNGAFWGEPRPGHPEGKIIYHIHEVLANVDKATSNPTLRRQLRLVTILHDTFKHLEEQERPRTDWSKHHAIYALNFAQKYITDQAVLDVIELHDEAFYAWRAYMYGHEDTANQKLKALKKRLGKDLQLFYLFFKCDTQTGDKYQMPVQWFEEAMKGIQIVPFQ